MTAQKFIRIAGKRARENYFRPFDFVAFGLTTFDLCPRETKAKNRRNFANAAATAAKPHTTISLKHTSMLDAVERKTTHKIHKNVLSGRRRKRSWSQPTALEIKAKRWRHCLPSSSERLWLISDIESLQLRLSSEQQQQVIQLAKSGDERTIKSEHFIQVHRSQRFRTESLPTTQTTMN